jgi:hypothetical protein
MFGSESCLYPGIHSWVLFAGIPYYEARLLCIFKSLSYVPKFIQPHVPFLLRNQLVSIHNGKAVPAVCRPALRL